MLPYIEDYGAQLRRFAALQAPWLLLFPGGAIVISAVGFNLLGDGLRESLDPRMRR